MADLAVGARSPARARAEARAGWLLSAPAVIGMAVLLLLPTLAVLVVSTTDYELGARGVGFVGLDNYRDLLDSRIFRLSFGNTALYAGLVAPASVLVGLAAALLIEAEPRFRALFRTIYFLPVVSLVVAMATAWQYLLHPTIGPVNAVLAALGLGRPNWLGSSDTVLYSLAAIGVWQQAGFNMVLFLAGLAAIPRDLYAAAEVDGVRTAWDRFATVTWPLLAPTTLFVATISLINAVKVFETVAAITQGEPSHASETLLWTIYQEGFVFLHVGSAAAMTVVLVAVLLVVTLVQTRVLDRRVHYG